MRLEGKTAFITGGNAGIGLATAKLFVAEGARVAITGRNAETLAAAKRELGDGVLTFVADVLDDDAMARAFADTAAAFGPIHAVFANAGIAGRTIIGSTPRAAFEQVIATNLTAVARVVDAVLPDLRQRGGGQVVVISSYAAWRFTPYAGVAYSASKSALAAVCQTLNAQEAEHGIRACHLCPGDVDTDFLEHRPVVPGAESRAVMLTADDVGRAVRFVLDSPAHVRIDELVISPLSQR